MIHWGKIKSIGCGLLLPLFIVGCETLVTQPQPEPVPEPEPVLEPQPELQIQPEPAPDITDDTENEPPKPAPVVDEELLLAQKVLKDMGLYSGQLDGIYGPKTRKALLDYQYWNGLALTGELDLQTKISLEQQ